MSLPLFKHMSTFIPNMDEDGRKELVETWMNDDLVKRQFNLECPSDEETPVVSVEEKVEVVEKTPENKKTPVKEKSQKVVGKKKFDPVKFLKANPDTPIKCIPENPKKPGTASYDFYEAYKNATTLKEFMDSGGQNVHIRYDFSKGFIHILDDSVENVIVETKKKSSPKKKPQKKQKVEKKKVEKTAEKKEQQKEMDEVIEQPTDEAKDESDDDDEVAFKPLSEVTTDEDIEEDEDEDWPSKIIEGVEYLYNVSDKILIDKETAAQVGYLDDDGTIDYIGNGEEVHEKNKANL